MKVKEVLQDQAWEVWDLLTKEECQDMLESAKQAGIDSTVAAGDTRNRDCLRIELDNEKLAEKIWERVKIFLSPITVVDSEYDKQIEEGILRPKDSIGTWKPYGVNDHFRICCYPGKGHFGPHRDAEHRIDDHKKSFLTINGYLTDREIGFGGATRLLVDDLELCQDKQGRFTISSTDDIRHRVEADCAGKAIAFRHGLMHDGEPLHEGSSPKWLFRTEILYERQPETAPTMTNSQLEARSLLKKAEEAESNGDIPTAIKCYNRAYRLDPKLES